MLSPRLISGKLDQQWRRDLIPGPQIWDVGIPSGGLPFCSTTPAPKLAIISIEWNKRYRRVSWSRLCGAQRSSLGPQQMSFLCHRIMDFWSWETDGNHVDLVIISLMRKGNSQTGTIFAKVNINNMTGTITRKSFWLCVTLKRKSGRIEIGLGL